MMNIKQLSIKIMFYIWWVNPIDSFAQNTNCSPDVTHFELIKESGIDTTKLRKSEFNCLIEQLSDDSIVITQVYGKNLIIKGFTIRGNKIGIWSCYHKGIKIFDIAYLGNQENRPIFIELWSKKGKHIRKTHLSIIE